MNLQSRSRLKFLTLAALLSGAVLTAQASTIIIDSTTLNGSFESGSGSGPNTADTWIPAVGATQTNRQTSFWVPPSDGTYSAILGTNADGTIVNGLLQNTGFNIESGQTFYLSFDWLAAIGWDTDDAIEFRVFTTSDDTIGGAISTIYSGSVSGLQEGGGAQNVSLAGIVTVVGANVGQDLWIEFIGSNNNAEFARVDNVVLTALPEPSAALFAGIFCLAGVMLRRR